MESDLEFFERVRGEAMAHTGEKRDPMFQALYETMNAMAMYGPYLEVLEEAFMKKDQSAYTAQLLIFLLNAYAQISDLQEGLPPFTEEEGARLLLFAHRVMSQISRNPDVWLPDMDEETLAHLVEDLVMKMLRNGELNDMLPGGMRIFIERNLTPYIRSPKSFLPISKVAKNQMLAVDELLSVDVGGNASVQTSITLQNGATLNEYDIEIQHTIGEMIQANGNQPITVTPAQIYREFAALMDKEKVTPEREEDVRESIDKMLEAKAVINFTDQVKKHKRLKKQKDVNYDKAMLEGHLIEGRKVTIITGGHVKTAYKLYDMPMYYMYSHAIGQIASVDKRLLNTSAHPGTNALPGAKKTRKNTKEFVVLKRMLAREVERMKRELAREERYEKRISYERICREIGLREPTDKQLRTLREDVDYMMEFWVSMGYIRGFVKYKAERAFVGVEVGL